MYERPSANLHWMKRTLHIDVHDYINSEVTCGVELIYFKGFVFYPYEDSENIKQKIKSTHKIIQHKNE